MMSTLIKCSGILSLSEITKPVYNKSSYDGYSSVFVVFNEAILQDHEQKKIKRFTYASESSLILR